MGGWRKYTPLFDPPRTNVDNSFWHGFDILMVIKICLASAVLWTIAYWKGDKDDYSAKDPNQRDCKKLTVTTDTVSGPTELTYSIETNWGESHADSCGHKKSVAYYAHLVPPSLMVLVGMGIPLPNLTIVTAQSRFVNIMELIWIVLGTINSAG